MPARSASASCVRPAATRCCRSKPPKSVGDAVAIVDSLSRLLPVSGACAGYHLVPVQIAGKEGRKAGMPLVFIVRAGRDAAWQPDPTTHREQQPWSIQSSTISNEPITEDVKPMLRGNG